MPFYSSDRPGMEWRAARQKAKRQGLWDGQGPGGPVGDLTGRDRPGMEWRGMRRDDPNWTGQGPGGPVATPDDTARLADLQARYQRLIAGGMNPQGARAALLMGKINPLAALAPYPQPQQQQGAPVQPPPGPQGY